MTPRLPPRGLGRRSAPPPKKNGRNVEPMKSFRKLSHIKQHVRLDYTVRLWFIAHHVQRVQRSIDRSGAYDVEGVLSKKCGREPPFHVLCIRPFPQSLGYDLSNRALNVGLGVRDDAEPWVLLYDEYLSSNTYVLRTTPGNATRPGFS